METRDQFTMLKLDKSMGEFGKKVPYFHGAKTPFEQRRGNKVVTITMTMIAENTASSRILSPSTARVSPMPAKINPTSPRGIMPMPIEIRFNFVESAQPACLLPDDSRHGQRSRQRQFQSETSCQNQFLNPSGRKITAQETRTRDEAFYRATAPPLVNICPTGYLF